MKVEIDGKKVAIKFHHFPEDRDDAYAKYVKSRPRPVRGVMLHCVSLGFTRYVNATNLSDETKTIYFEEDDGSDSKTVQLRPGEQEAFVELVWDYRPSNTPCPPAPLACR